jgi:succinate-acetate transporter protein
MIPKVFVGLEIFITGLIAWYIATAELVNGIAKKMVLPLK